MAASPLVSVGADAKPCVPVLVDALRCNDVAIRRVAAETLEKIGPAAKSAAPALAPLLSVDDHGVRCSVAAALAGIGADVKSVVSVLIELSGDDEIAVRVLAIQTLGHRRQGEAGTTGPDGTALGQSSSGPAGGCGSLGEDSMKLILLAVVGSVFLIIVPRSNSSAFDRGSPHPASNSPLIQKTSQWLRRTAAWYHESYLLKCSLARLVVHWPG